MDRLRLETLFIAMTIMIAAATPCFGMTPEQQVAQLLPRLHPIPDDEWKSIAGSHASETYQIVPGDTLWDLSRRLFGDSKYWPKIWALNGAGLGSAGMTNPHLIMPGKSILFQRGSGSTLPQVSFSDGHASDVAVNDGAHTDIPLGRTSQEWRKLPRQSWELSSVASAAVASDGIDSRSKVRFKSSTGLDLEYRIYSNPIEPIGTITAGREPHTAFMMGDVLFIQARGDQLQVGELYTVTNKAFALHFAKEGGRKGWVYPIAGNLKIIGVKDGLFVGMIVSNRFRVFRGDLVIPMIKKIPPVSLVAGPSVLEATLKSNPANSTLMISQHKAVFIDRGSEDGVRPGMVFRAFTHRDPGTGKKVTDSDFIIDGDMVVMSVSEQVSTAVMLRTSVAVRDGAPVLLLTDISDLTRRKGVRSRGMDGDTGSNLDALDLLDVSGGLGKKEATELRQLERYKEEQPSKEPEPPLPNELDTVDSGIPPTDAPPAPAPPLPPDEAAPLAAPPQVPPSASAMPSDPVAPAPGELDDPVPPIPNASAPRADPMQQAAAPKNISPAIEPGTSGQPALPNPPSPPPGEDLESLDRMLNN